ncbi:hypothetical protein BLNAU_11809 [Blattamonas nauphoetae]|uniref:Uncharacterized protein n=1 Tax=Blattamonas nauphoetae TaxID=2049346 RepID=A0ABQ9XQQ8_9EUKA|nr:hypothetical protein BLNAU_11809 [Blattamonas nauphoetae]
MSIGIHASGIYCPFVISERNFIDFTSSGLSNACGAVPIAFTAGSSQSVLVQKPTFENCSAGHRSGVLHQHRAMTLVQTTNYRFPACSCQCHLLHSKIERLLRQPHGTTVGKAKLQR